MEKFFKLKENGTNVKTEFMAGLTTFFAMVYILMVNANMFANPFGDGTPVLGVIKPEHNAFLDEVRAQSGVELFPLTIENREEAPAAIAAWYARASREKRA